MKNLSSIETSAVCGAEIVVTVNYCDLTKYGNKTVLGRFSFAKSAGLADAEEKAILKAMKLNITGYGLECKEGIPVGSKAETSAEVNEEL